MKDAKKKFYNADEISDAIEFLKTENKRDSLCREKDLQGILQPGT